MTNQKLPCGHDPLDVWDHAAADRIDSHEQTCSYCQGVIDEYRTLAAATREWRDEPVDVPTGLLERVMATVRAAMKARNYLPLVSPYGPVRLDVVTAAAVLRWTIDQHGDARARSCKIEAVVGTTDPVGPLTTGPEMPHPATDPQTIDPPTTDPVGTDPVGTDPAGTDPAGTDPPATDPAGTDPAGTDPAGTDPAGTDPAVIDLTAAEPIVAVRATVTAALGVRLPELAGELRMLIRSVGRDLLGLDVTTVDITFVDLFDPVG